MHKMDQQPFFDQNQNKHHLLFLGHLLLHNHFQNFQNLVYQLFYQLHL